MVADKVNASLGFGIKEKVGVPFLGVNLLSVGQDNLLGTFKLILNRSKREVVFVKDTKKGCVFKGT